MFHRQGKLSPTNKAKSLKNLTKILPPLQLLADAKRKELLEQMQGLSALDPSRYESHCQVLINNLVNYYQSLPETSHNFYSQPGGLMDHALNRTEAALSLFRQFVILDEQGEFSEQQALWQYALYSASLLKGIGKLYTDYRVELYDAKGQVLKPWNPLLEHLAEIGKYYDYSFDKEGDKEFRRRLNIVIARAVMPAHGFSWLASEPEILAIWLALINEDERSAGTLGALLIRANAIALQRYMDQFMVKGHAGRGGGRFGRIGAFSDTTPESLVDKEQMLAVEFIQWLSKMLGEGLIQINQSPLFMVPGGMLMSADLFKWFIREHPEYKNWQMVQNALLSLGLHDVGRDGEVMTRFEQANTQKIHTGVVLNEYALLLPNEVKVHQMSTGKVTTQSAIDVIHSAESGNQFLRSQAAPAQSAVQSLNASGQWQQPESGQPSAQPGAKGRG